MNNEQAAHGGTDAIGSIASVSCCADLDLHPISARIIGMIYRLPEKPESLDVMKDAGLTHRMARLPILPTVSHGDRWRGQQKRGIGQGVVAVSVAILPSDKS